MRKSLNATHSASYGVPEGTECDIEARRIESVEGRHYVLIRGKDIATSCEDRCEEQDDFLRLDFRSKGAQSVEETKESSASTSPTTQGQFQNLLQYLATKITELICACKFHALVGMQFF